MTFTVHIIPILRDNYCYLITRPDNSCLIVDPGQVNPVRATIEQRGLKPVLILNTHHHADHVAGNLELKQQYGIPVYAPAAEENKIPHADHGLKEGDDVEGLKVLFTPGHTAGHISFYSEENNALFCGDVLFSMGCGRIMEGMPADLWSSLQMIKALPPQTNIYCGHEYTQNNGAFAQTIYPDHWDIQTRMEEVRKLRTNNLPTLPVTIGTELKTNPFLMAQDLATFTDLRQRKDRF